MNIGTVTKQAKFISMEHENKLWEKGVLGEDTPDKLRSTVLFLIGVNVGLRAGDDMIVMINISNSHLKGPNLVNVALYIVKTVCQMMVA